MLHFISVPFISVSLYLQKFKHIFIFNTTFKTKGKPSVELIFENKFASLMHYRQHNLLGQEDGRGSHREFD
jgi:hypothetical protein